MNKIITIGREFGSGGREFGRRLAEGLGIEYYDKEIIAKIAKRADLAEDYVQEVVENRPMPLFPMTIGATFAAVGVYYPMMMEENVYAAQTEVLQELAEKSDCVIVGRCADYILKSYNPYRFFVYADMPSRIERGMKRASADEKISEKDMKKKIKSIVLSTMSTIPARSGEQDRIMISLLTPLAVILQSLLRTLSTC